MLSIVSISQGNQQSWCTDWNDRCTFCWSSGNLFLSHPICEQGHHAAHPLDQHLNFDLRLGGTYAKSATLAANDGLFEDCAKALRTRRSTLSKLYALKSIRCIRGSTTQENHYLDISCMDQFIHVWNHFRKVPDCFVEVCCNFLWLSISEIANVCIWKYLSYTREL